MLVTALMLSIALLSAQPNEQYAVSKTFADLFEAHEYRCDGGANQQEICIRYRLFVPHDLKPGERCPLLLWLHGKGEGGMDNQMNLKYLPMVLKDTERIEQYRFFILVPQCPSRDITWSSSLGIANAGASDTNDMLGITHAILQKTMQEHLVDQDRLYLNGICSGGKACWEMAMRHPEIYAAMVLMTPGGGDVTRAAKLANMPIWAFQFEKPDDANGMVDAVKRAGGNIHLTTASYQTHDSWSTALRHYNIMAWMLAQHRDPLIYWTPPGHRAWRWWHILGVPLGFLTIVGIGAISEKKRRRKNVRMAASTHESIRQESL
jgi:predicted peptidase